MRWRVLIALSIALNVALGVMLWRETHDVPSQFAPADPLQVAVTTNVTRTNVVVRRQFFNWTEIESDDYPTYIANLRRIGCPDSTIRDIIVADVNQMFAQRRATEITTSESQWWKSDPDLDATDAAVKKGGDLERERVALLTKLLGPNWNIGIQPTEKGTVALDGPVLGKLPIETKRHIQEIAATSARRAQDYIEQQRVAGKSLDPTELAKMRMEQRQELAKFLTADQLEEYLLRHSANAEQLREQLRGFNATPDEFRAIFRARDAIDNDIQLRYSGSDAATTRARQDLEKLRDSAVDQALGPDRASLYRATGDPLFREAQLLAQQVGAAPEKVLPLYQIQVESSRERARISGDNSMTPSERATAIRAVSDQEEAARRKLLNLPAEDQAQVAQ